MGHGKRSSAEAASCRFALTDPNRPSAVSGARALRRVVGAAVGMAVALVSCGTDLAGAPTTAATTVASATESLFEDVTTSVTGAPSSSQSASAETSGAPPDGGDVCAPRKVTVTQPPGTIAGGDDVLAVLVASGFCASFEMTFENAGTTAAPVTFPARSLVNANEAMCIGTGLVRALGTARVRELGLAQTPWDTLSFGLSNNDDDRQVQADEAAATVSVFRACSPAWESLLIMSVTEGADELTETETRCVMDALDDDVAAAVFASELDRPYDDPTVESPSFPEIIEPLIDAFDSCPIAAHLDWN